MRQAEVVLRQMTAADLPAVMEIERATFPADAWSEAMLRGELRDQPRTRHYLVAEVDERVAGYAGLAVAADQADVQTIAVLAAHRRAGVGAALMDALLAEAARRGATAVFLEVRADNPRHRRCTSGSASAASACEGATTRTERTPSP